MCPSAWRVRFRRATRAIPFDRSVCSHEVRTCNRQYDTVKVPESVTAARRTTMTSGRVQVRELEMRSPLLGARPSTFRIEPKSSSELLDITSIAKPCRHESEPAERADASVHVTADAHPSFHLSDCERSNPPTPSAPCQEGSAPPKHLFVVTSVHFITHAQRRAEPRSRTTAF